MVPVTSSLVTSSLVTLLCFLFERCPKLGFREELAGAATGLKELKKRGIRILGGGDYGFFVTPHGENARDLDHLIRFCDFTPMEALLTMTKNTAEPQWIYPTNWDRFNQGSSPTCFWSQVTRLMIRKYCSTEATCSPS